MKLDADPQIDNLLAILIELARYVRAGQSGHFAIEFSAHKGEITTAHTTAKVPKQMPPRGGK